jgi:hypothetical protein
MEPQPTPTEREQEEGPERLHEEEDMRGPLDPDPDLPTESEDDD